jgi:chromosome segregation ATPase
MAKSDISQLENKIKLSLLQTEKRLVDLEVAVTELKELKEKIKDIDFSQVAEIPNLKQKIEDLEDLVMVENLGIEEVKKVLSEAKIKLENIPESTEKISELYEALKKIQEVEKKIENIDAVRQQVENLANKLTDLKLEIETIKGMKSRRDPELEIVATKVDSLKDIVNDLITKKVELGVKIEGLEKRLELLHTKTPQELPRYIEVKIENYQKRLDSVLSKIHAMEEKFDLVEKELEKSYGKEQKVGDQDLREKLMRFENIEKRISELDAKLKSWEVPGDYKELQRRIDELKLMMNDRVKKAEVYDTIEKAMNRLNSKITGLSSEVEEMKKEVNKLSVVSVPQRERVEAASEIQGTLDLLHTEIQDLLNRLVSLESRIAALERYFQPEGRAELPIILE